MSDIASLQEKREAKRKASLDARYALEPDAEIQIWINPDTGRVGQVYHNLSNVTKIDEQNKGMRHVFLEALWMVCGEQVPEDKADNSIALTVAVDNDGWLNMTSHQYLEVACGWPHVRWVLRQWWRVTLWWWKLAWRMWRHPQPWRPR